MVNVGTNSFAWNDFTVKWSSYKIVLVKTMNGTKNGVAGSIMIKYIVLVQNFYPYWLISNSME